MMNSFKYWLVRGAALLAALALWLSTAKWLPILYAQIAKHSQHCIDMSSPACDAYFARLGQTGDLFGAVTSLFSALAILGVAVTLWADARARREGLRPLVIANFEEFPALEKASLESPKQISLNAIIVVANQTDDAALNSSISCAIFNSRFRRSLPVPSLEAPLIRSADRRLELKHQLSGNDLNEILTHLTQQDTVINFEVKVDYESLESVRWSTSVVYELRCTKHDDMARLNAFRSENPVQFASEWASNPLIQLEGSVKTGSWKHGKRI